MEALVNMQNITKGFYGVEVLHSVNFDVRAGEVVALCGENGAGKSTLMKILAAIHKQDAGDITILGSPLHNATPLEVQSMGISMIHQELNLLEDLSVAQNIFLSREPKNKLGLIDFKRMNSEAKKLLEGLGEDIEPTAKVCTLKIAKKQMVEIAKAISFDVKVLIMDEPTSVLTLKETEVLFQLIKSLTQRGIGIVYISHRLREVKEIADRVTVLRDGTFVATKCTDEVCERDIAQLMVGREIAESIAEDFTGDPTDMALEVRGVSADFLKDISFSVAKGEIIGFSGLIGAGRSELMELIFGLRKCESGEILLEGKPACFKNARTAIAGGMGFATEDRKRTGLVTCRSIGENADYAFQVKNKGFVIRPTDVKKRTGTMMKRLSIKCQGHWQAAKNLSGGNQQKVVLAKWLAVDPKILIVDEPTRGIDVGARAEIYNILQELAREGKTILVVSSDLTEILSISQRIIVMHEGTVTGVLTGDERTEQNIMNLAANV